MKIKSILTILLPALVIAACNTGETMPTGTTSSPDNVTHSQPETQAITSKETMTQSPNSEIDILLQKAKASGNAEDLSGLWKATLNLPQWHFIAKHTQRTEDRKPFIGVIENQPWVFMFTDRQKAREYGASVKDGGFADENGNVTVISMDTQKAIDYLMSLSSKGVYGMRINELDGWYSPIANLPAIIKYVK